MTGVPGRSPVPVYLVMGVIVVAVVVGLNLATAPGADERAGPSPTAVGSIGPAPPTLVEGFGSTIERDFLPTVLARPHVSRSRRYCDDQGCCPTWRTVFGTTTRSDVVVATFRSQGFEPAPGDRAVVRPGPFPQVAWTGVAGPRARRTWRMIEVARGQDVGRPAWPTVFVQSSAACVARRR